MRAAPNVSWIKMISSTRPMAATPQTSSTVKAKDSDMARSLVGHRIVAMDLLQPAFHDRASRHVGFPPGHRPAVERRPCLGITQSLVKRAGAGVVMLNEHPGDRATMIDDLLLQRGDQLSSDPQRLEPFMDRQHPDTAGVLRWPEVHPTHGDQPVVRQASHEQGNISDAAGFEGGGNSTNMLWPTRPAQIAQVGCFKITKTQP